MSDNVLGKREWRFLGLAFLFTAFFYLPGGMPAAALTASIFTIVAWRKGKSPAIIWTLAVVALILAVLAAVFWADGHLGQTVLTTFSS